MAKDLPIQCSCGALRGVLRGVSGEHGNRIVCYCDDCQTFAHFLERAAEILDPHGGTDIFQTSPVRLEITEGADRLACIRLTSRGIVRWYTSCCKTPIGNTLPTRQMPFVGLVHSCMDSNSRDAALGPVRSRVQARYAVGDRSSLDAVDGAPRGMLPRLLWMMLLNRLHGDHVGSPFFDPASGAAVATPHVLTAEELRTVVTARDAWEPGESG